VSEYAYLICRDDRVMLGLGRAIKRDDGSVHYFLSGGKQPNSQQPDLDRALWKFLADHTGHRIEVIRESSRAYQDWTVDQDANGIYRQVGGDARDDIPFEQFLAGWPG
jgi:hypothetical protein